MGTTLFPNGVTNAIPNTFGDLADLPYPDPARYIVFWDDFFHYAVGAEAGERASPGVGGESYIFFETQAAATRQVQTVVEGGVLLFQNSGADADVNMIQWVTENFGWTVDRKAWFAARFAVDDASLSDFVAGLQIVNTSPLGADDGIFFEHLNGVLGLVVVDNDVRSVVTLNANVADTQLHEYGWYYDGQGSFKAFFDGELVGEINDVTNAPQSIMTPTVGLVNGSAVARLLSLDYLSMAKERR